MIFRIQPVPAHRAMIRDRIDITVRLRHHPGARAFVLWLFGVANRAPSEEEKWRFIRDVARSMEAQQERMERRQALLQSLPLDTLHTA